MQIRLFGGLDRKSKLHKIPDTYAQLAANFTYTGRRFRPAYGMLQLEQVPDNSDQLFLVETVQATNSNTFTQVASAVSESNVGHGLVDVGFETWQVWYPNRYSGLMPVLFESNVGHDVGLLGIEFKQDAVSFSSNVALSDIIATDLHYFSTRVDRQLRDDADAACYAQVISSDIRYFATRRTFERHALPDAVTVGSIAATELRNWVARINVSADKGNDSAVSSHIIATEVRKWTVL